jgi:hypothetical protein
MAMQMAMHWVTRTAMRWATQTVMRWDSRWAIPMAIRSD